MITFELLTLGNLTRNKFWGESDEKGLRPVLATSTLIVSDKHKIVVDPSCENIEEKLFNHSGLKANDIDIVYVTHKHKDHFTGIEVFKDAKWYMANEDLEFLKNNPIAGEEDNINRFLPVGDKLCEDIETVKLPGHTIGCTGLFFKTSEGRVLVSGDAIADKNYFKNDTPYFFCEDYKKNVETIKANKDIADIIVPGHGNYFLVKGYKNA